MIGQFKWRSGRSSANLEMLEYFVSGQQIDTFCNIEIKQKFVNKTANTVECSYVFPNDCKFCIYSTEFVVDGNLIRPLLKEKEEAKRDFNEAVKAGHLAMIGRDLGNGTCEIKLGNLEKDKELEIHIKASFLCIYANKGTSLKFPLAAKFQSGTVTSSIPESVNFKFDMKIHHNTSNIKSVNCTVGSRITKEDDKTYNVSIRGAPKVDSIFIDTDLDDGCKSSAIASDGFISISAYPSFETKVESNSEFVFIVDCSGSMSGHKIKNAAECMKVFIHSLPNNCKFAIWRFGTYPDCMIESSDYTKENIKIASDLIDSMTANLGGTDLMRPIKQVMESPIPNGFTRQMFVLTDGYIHNTKDVIGLVRSMRSANRIFSIGLGSEADPGLINGLAEIANGKGIIVNDYDESLEEKVIDLLETAIQPAITNVTFKCEGMTEQWPSPAPAVYSNSQQNFIIKAPYQEYVLISGAISNDNVDEMIKVNKVQDGIGLKELFMSKAIDDLQYDLRVAMDEEKKAKVIEYSLASNVLSEYTAFVGVNYNSFIIDDEDIVHKYSPIKTPLTLCRCCCRKMISKPKRKFICEDAGSPCNDESNFDEELPMIMAAPSLECDRKICNKTHYVRSIQSIKADDETRQIKPITIDEIIDSQNPDGSWDTARNINPELVTRFNQNIAAIIACIAYIRKHAGSKLNSLKLIIKKAINILNKYNQSIDWESLIHEEESKL